VIGADTRDSCSEKLVKGDPAGSEAARRLPNRPLKSERLEWKSQARLTEFFRKKTGASSVFVSHFSRLLKWPLPIKDSGKTM
jgi:hypothetical protein